MLRIADDEIMKCHVGGGKLEKTVTDFPFKVRHNSIVIVKCLPILQCDNCQEYLIEDEVMAALEQLLKKNLSDAELEIIRYAA